LPRIAIERKTRHRSVTTFFCLLGEFVSWLLLCVSVSDIIFLTRKTNAIADFFESVSRKKERVGG
jgi:hypothetical protein